jgi:hypothetical protein
MILEKNPELQRLVFGEQFAAKPQKLLQPNEVVDDYLGLNPKIKELVTKQRETHAELEPKLKFAEEQKEFDKVIRSIPNLQKDIEVAERLAGKIRQTEAEKAQIKSVIDKLKGAGVEKFSNKILKKFGLYKLFGFF